MKKKKTNNIFLAALFLVGLSILLYPTISNRWNEYRAKQLISNYTNTVKTDAEADPEGYAQMLEAARAYNAALEQEKVPDAFSIRDGIEDEEYDALLNASEDGMMGVVEIPVIGEKIPIYHYTSDESLEKGAGHLFGSSLPVGGEGTHTIVSAHRGLPSAKLFTDLPVLQEGDVFYFQVFGDTLAYEVDGVETVEPDQVESLAIREGEDLATLITCTPYAVNSHRLLVHGHRIPFVEEEYAEQQKTAPKKDTTQLWMQLLCVVIGILIAIVLVWLMNRRSRRRARRQERGKKE